MAADTLTPVVEYLRRVTAPPKDAGLSDGELLERFAGRRDQAAFAALVQRHGPMVMGVCRRLLRDCHEAEDAWQATFLILARRAGAIARRELLAGWLYGVAYRTARRARRVAARRQARERPGGDDVARASAPAGFWPDLRPILDEGIERLPEKYRLPIILCYFESRTNTEAARLLNCPRGTVATRLARARERLRRRLTRRGVTLSVGAVTLALSQGAVPAGVPTAGAVTASAAFLAQGVMRTMALTKLKAVLALALTAGVVCSASGLVGLRTRASENAHAEPARQADAGAILPATPAAGPGRANLEDQIYAALRKDHHWKSRGRGCAVWVREVKDRLLTDALFKRYDADGVADVVARAGEAEIRVAPARPEIRIHARHVQAMSPTGGWIYFAERVFTFPLAPPAPKARTDQFADKPRADASINLLGLSTTLSLTGERLDPPAKMALSCEDFRIEDRSVRFHDRVRAVQGSTRLDCTAFQVVLDEPIQAIGEVGSRRWKECRCDGAVRLEDRVREGGRLVHYTRLAAPALTIGGKGAPRDVGTERRNGLTYRVTIGGEEGGLRAAGPGTFHDLHQGPAGGPGVGGALTLWRISYQGRARISSPERHVCFEDQVEVACVPSDEPDAVIDRDRLPDGGLTFAGGTVTFLGQKSVKRQGGRRLLIRGHAVVRNTEVWGQAEAIDYDEDTGRLTLRADDGAPAFLLRSQKDGDHPQRITGQKIFYSLRTRELQVQKGGGASASP